VDQGLEEMQMQRKNNKARREDKVVAEAIKAGRSFLLEKIRILFNLCLHSCIVPDQWYEATTILIHKKEDKTNLENYLKSHLHKLFTRVITSRLENTLEYYQPREQADRTLTEH